jgi:ribosomal protein L11 methyltransferase
VLLAYFAGADDVEGRARSALGSLSGARVDAVPVPEVDWVARFRESFRAFRAAGFEILPAWERPRGPEGPRELLVDPGRAFGTGTHETTRLCLEALRRIADGPGLGAVVDVGTGSGLLAIAALGLGATFAVGVDNDPEAVRAAAEHAALNRVALPSFVGDGGQAVRPGLFDTVLANLMAPLLLDKRAELDRLRKPSGRLVLSGLLLEDLRLVREAYAGLGTLEELREGEWAALIVGQPR